MTQISSVKKLNEADKGLLNKVGINLSASNNEKELLSVSILLTGEK